MGIHRKNWQHNRSVVRCVSSEIPPRSNVTTSFSPNIDSSRADMLISGVVWWSIATLNIVVDGRIAIQARSRSEQFANSSRRHPSKGCLHKIIANVVVKCGSTITAITNGIGIRPTNTTWIDPLGCNIQNYSDILVHWFCVAWFRGAKHSSRQEGKMLSHPD